MIKSLLYSVIFCTCSMAASRAWVHCAWHIVRMIALISTADPHFQAPGAPAPPAAARRAAWGTFRKLMPSVHISSFKSPVTSARAMRASLAVLVYTALHLAQTANATSCDLPNLVCRQNEGRPCTDAELISPYLDEHVVRGYITSFHSTSIFSDVKLFNVCPHCMVAYSPALFVHDGKLRAFLRIDFDFANVQPCPPHHITSHTRCPQDGHSVSVYSAIAHGQLSNQLHFDAPESWVMMNEDLTAAASYSHRYLPAKARAFTWGDEVWVVYTNDIGTARHRVFAQRALPSETAPVHLHVAKSTSQGTK